jgi:hypothetical protein
MSKNLLTIEAFAEWAERQPADKSYHWFSEDDCAAAQYAKFLGLHRDFLERESGSFWNRASKAALDMRRARHTFGALAKRLRSLSA